MVFLGHAVESRKNITSLSDVEVVKKYDDVFPDKLSGFQPPRQVELHIDLVLGATPIAKEPYWLVPSEMKEMISQLQKLLERGFI